MHPILARYGPFFLYSYTVVHLLSLGLGLGLTAWLARRRRVEPSRWLDDVLAAGLVGLLGGRAAYVWANWDYFQVHTEEIGRLWLGGFSYHGVLLTALLGLWLWTRRPERSFLMVGGLLAPALALLHAGGWLACWLEGCGYGRETAIGLLAGDLPDTYGVRAVRYHTQAAGLLLSLLVLAAVLAVRPRLRDGTLFWLTLLALGLVQLGVSLYRGDAMAVLGPLRLDSWLNGALAVGAAGALIWSRLSKRGAGSPALLVSE
ncbi:MAG: prolipoprotein diacylglyceryl transferase [Candidatus Promineifilaceae bacterium]|nr:prolipoprotein diacylglyceryl transferase [Candidatus Promineifilaceae bacterium]